MKRLSNSLPYSWYWYFIVVIVACALWTVLFQVYHAPTAEESMYVFFAGNVVDDSFKNDVQTLLADDGVILVNVSSINPNDRAFYTKYNAMGLNNSNVVIVPQSVAESTLCEGSFVELTDNYGCQTFVQEGVTYGLYLSDQVKTELLKYFEFSQERYVVFVSDTSVNSQSDTVAVNSLKLVRWLVN